MDSAAAPASIPPKLRFNCYLLRADLPSPEKALRAPYRPGGKSEMVPVQPTTDAPDGTVGYFSQPKEKVPPWAKALAPLFPDLAQIQNLSNRFVIFLPVGARWFAVCFGYGSSTLEWSAVEANFGLRFAARRMSAQSLREFRSRRVGASNRTQVIQMPLGGNLKDLDVALEGEFVRRLAGTLDASDGAQFDDIDAVAATDAISFRARTDLRKVQQTLAAMLGEVEERTASEGLKFVDSLEPLRAKSEETTRLDRRLAHSLFADMGYTAEQDVLPGLQEYMLDFALPDTLQTDEIDEIRVHRGERVVALPSMTVDGLRAALHELKVRPTVRSLDGVKLMAFDGEGEPRSQYLPLRNWLVFEAGDADRRYILTLGRWFALVESYTQQLDADLSKIEDVTAVLNPPAWPASLREGQYNTLFHQSRPGDTIVLDTVDIRSEDGDEIEACDLLDRSGRLIHVKNYKYSQTLSHLFSQGLVSAISLRRDPAYQANFRQAVEGLDPTFTQIAERAPEVVVYAIAVRDQRPIPAGLPSFSKVNLRDFTKRVQITGARPAVCRIQIIDDNGT